MASNKGFLFLSRVAVLVNIFFMLCLIIRHTSISYPLMLKDVTIITGWIIAPVLTFLVNGWLVVLLLRKRIEKVLWLMIVNVLIGGLQLFYLFL